MLDDPTLPRLLDAPVRASFAESWQPHALTRNGAAMLQPEIGPFAAAASDAPEDQADLAALIARRAAPVLVTQVAEIPIPPGRELLSLVKGVQMVATDDASAAEIDSLTLGPANAPEMLALAQLTQPGPFELRTYRLGTFIGLRENGALIAMAGQRMGFAGLREISGVCVHPEHRGQGLATALIRAMIGQIRADGDRPFLHTYADNAVAIQLYERLSFAQRAEVNVAQIA
ncbi:GNAT family N-acetyltransferase [Dinoroseobacter sp. S375]|uniref:GNAT family N-acetyltransferase n=1 Tax=Dinoroseobacter sp. S375 TaxID=3415136 RepID=UPI003C7E72A5